MEFYEGIDQIFKDNDTVPSIGLWPTMNYRSNMVRYVVWGMANPQPGADRLLFKPQATMVRKIAERMDNPQILPSIRSIQYIILEDRLPGRGINEDILEVTDKEANRYAQLLLQQSPTGGTAKRELKKTAEITAKKQRRNGL